MRKIHLLAAALVLSCILMLCPAASAAAVQPDTPAVSAAENAARLRLDRSSLQMTIPAGVNAAYAQLRVTSDPAGGSIRWSSSNTGVASVDYNGVVTAHQTGTAVITARNDRGQTAACTVTVEREVPHSALADTSLTLVQQWNDLTPKRQLTLRSVAWAGCYVYQWSSADPSVATVDGSGVVTAVAPGRTTITARTTAGETLTCTVTVRSDIGKITLNADTILLPELGTQSRLTASVAVRDPASVPLTWSSSDPAAVTVSTDGVVTAVGDGTAVITVTSTDGHQAECTVYAGQAAVQLQREEKLFTALAIGGIVLLVGTVVLVMMTQ